MEQTSHWDTVYQQKRPDEVSWYQAHLEISLGLLANAGLSPRSRVIDVGGGVSTLVDDLLAHGVSEVTVLDISPRALAAAKTRLSEKAERVRWIQADITAAQLSGGSYDLWHDRAVFHFLTHAEDRRRYVDTMRRALKPGGQAVLATFALDGPPRCSGLEVVRYSPDTLQQELGSGFKLAETLPEAHQTPFHATQRFVYGRFLRLPD